MRDGIITTGNDHIDIHLQRQKLYRDQGPELVDSYQDLNKIATYRSS